MRRNRLLQIDASFIKEIRGPRHEKHHRDPLDAARSRPSATAATRLFRQEPVLKLDARSPEPKHGWIGDDDSLLGRSARSDRAHRQRKADADMLVKGPRHTIPQSSKPIAAAQKFADGWRGGLLGTCEFDLRLLSPPGVIEIAKHRTAMRCFWSILPPAWSIRRSSTRPSSMHEIACRLRDSLQQAAPGLAGALVRHDRFWNARRAANASRPNAALHARSARSRPDRRRRLRAPFRRPSRAPPDDSSSIRSAKSIASPTAAISLNGTLVIPARRKSLNRLEAHREPDILPRDVVDRTDHPAHHRPIFARIASLTISRPDLVARHRKEDLRATRRFTTTLRITLRRRRRSAAARSDFCDIIAAARDSGHLRDSCRNRSADARRANRRALVGCGVDVVSVHLPAMQPATYAKIMGVDRMAGVLENIKHFVIHRQHSSPRRAAARADIS